MRVIYDVHEDVPRQNLSKQYIPAMFRRPLSAIVECVENICARRFYVITATPSINRRFMRLGVNAININNYPLVSEFNFLGSRWDKKERAVCYVGGIEDVRGATEMVNAIGMIECRLILAGEFAPGVKDRLARMRGWKHVEVLGFVGREGVKATTCRSMAGLVLLHPLLNYLEALPVKMFEYMAAGIPVIASNFPLWRNIIEGAACGICVNPLDPNEIVEAICRVINHPVEAKQMGDNGRKAIRATYNWDIEEQKLINFYSEIGN